MKLTRRQLVAGAAGAALGAAGIYELADQLSGSPARTAAVPLGPRSVEQHVLDGIPVVEQDGVQVIVPPRHHLVVTATVKPGTDLAKAQPELEQALRELESRYEQTPAGLGLTVAWGVPYFDRHVAAAAEKHVPFDRRAQKPALLATRTFPSDPHDTRLEENDVALLIRSDRLEHIEDARKTLLDDLGVFEPASLRRGFVGGNLPRKLAIAAGVPGAYLIPHDSELFLGFTSTQKAGLGPRRIANFETLGLVDLRGGYFRGGTHMHLSHIFEDLEAWYLNFEFQERVDTAFRPGLKVKENAQVVPQGPKQVSSAPRGGAGLQQRRPVRPQRVDPDELAASAGHDGRGRHGLREGNRHSAARRLQHARQPVRVVGRPEARRRHRRRRGRRPLRRLQSVQRRLPPQPARHGRRAAGRDEAPAAAAGARPGLQLRAAHDAPPELPRPAARAPVVPARRA